MAFLRVRRLRVAAKESSIVKKEEVLSLGPTKAKIRFRLEDGSHIDVFVNAALDKRYFHWQKLDGKIYRVNNFPPEGWHVHVDYEDIKKPFREITPREFFGEVKKRLLSTK